MSVLLKASAANDKTHQNIEYQRNRQQDIIIDNYINPAIAAGKFSTNICCHNPNIQYKFLRHIVSWLCMNDYTIEYRLVPFDDTYEANPLDTPPCSAQDFYEEFFSSKYIPYISVFWYDEDETEE